MKGVLLIDKPSGPSSFEVLRDLKKRCKTAQMGYLGTLDPLASGLLMVFVGKATKLIRYCKDLNKQYLVGFELGKHSDTFDSTGSMTVVEGAQLPSEQALLSGLEAFLGLQWQIQPQFSALKFQGKRAYEHAREGKTFDLGKRQVIFESLDLVSYTPPSAVVDVVCSGGTYIRSLVHELGEALQCGAVMTSLERTAIGSFDLTSATLPEKCNEELLISIPEFLDQLSEEVPSLAKEKAYLLRKLAD